MTRYLPLACIVSLGAGLVLAPFCLLPALDLASGTLAHEDWITSHRGWWALGWAAVTVAMACLASFFTWWAARMLSGPVVAFVAAIAWAAFVIDVIGMAGLVFDMSASLDRSVQMATQLSGGWATGLDALAGVILTARGTLSGRDRRISWICWSGGLVMAVGVLAGRPTLLLAGLVVNWIGVPIVVWMVTRQIGRDRLGMY